jgi:DNA end-binding protein Ku
MAPRAYWKGYLRLSLVSCPVSLFPATSDSEKVHFHQIDSKTGNRIRYRKVDGGTGEEVPPEHIVKGYEVRKGHYIEITDEELEAIALESTRTIDIDQFVPRNEIDELYYVRPYYIAPDGKAGQDAFVVIRKVIEAMDMVAIARIVLTTREHIIALESRGKGIVGTLLRFPYEVRDERDYFDEIADTKLGKDAMDLAKHIVETKSGHFKPGNFEDHYEKALRELVAKKQAGEPIEAPKAPASAKVINLMDALKQSIAAGQGARKKRAPPTPKHRARKPARRSAKAARKAG